ncbi:MAG TPA: transglutaminase family protein [Parvibaculum sp.]|jgi:transglutaminase-like putative cysteine protease
MFIRYGYEMSFTFPQATPVVALLDIHRERAKDILDEEPFKARPFASGFTGIDFFGNRYRHFVAPQGQVTISASGVIEDIGCGDAVNCDARETPLSDLPPEALFYLTGSRYCETDKLGQMAWDLFGKGPSGWARVQAICDFVHDRLSFGYEHARNTRTAAETHFERKGVCRDFAHLAITLCRAMNIPARYVNGYLGDIGVPPDPAPMDFSAWFEACLDGHWYTFDARHNVPRIGRIVVARGRDAADVPLINSFGAHEITRFKIVAEEVASPMLDLTELSPQPIEIPVGLRAAF